MTAFFRGNAIAAPTYPKATPSHLMVCDGKIGKHGGTFDRKRRQKGGHYGKDKGAIQSAIGPKRI